MAKSRLGRRVRFWLAAPIVAAALFFVPLPAVWIDRWYAQGVYPWIQNGLTAVTNVIPGATIDWMIAITAVGVLLRCVQAVLRALTGHPMAAFADVFRRGVRFVGILLVLFQLCWGLNYRRLPLESSLPDHGAATIDTAVLRASILQANTLASRVRPRDPAESDVSYAVLAERLRAPMQEALAMLHRAPLARPGRPKTSMILTPFFTWAGVNGMINPLALESIVHPDLVPAERAFVLAHEWAHLAGHADEAEASAVGWLACMKGGPTLAYSASIYLIIEAAGAMPRGDWRAVSANLDAGVRADLIRISERMREQKPRVQQTATKVYDGYLKANRVPDGAASYSRALTLILTPQFRELLTSSNAKR